MSALDDVEQIIREEAERKIAAGRNLANIVRDFGPWQEAYRAAYNEARSAGFSETDLKRLGLTVDGVKTSARVSMNSRGRSGRKAALSQAAMRDPAVSEAGEQAAPASS
ncbi:MULTISPECIES: hypothetical protein [Nocardia]|uniref:hypothetical protein n=1 Tax=Nocardia TaxID=1817 RepID=UPI002458384B|nr:MULTISPECIES: hypothetical protein [Nocardia]